LRVLPYIVLTLCMPVLLAAQPSPDFHPPVITFSVEGGFMNFPIDLRLLAADADIYYTTNGNQPSRHAKRYDGPIRITETTVVRAVAYQNGQRSDFVSQTYFIDEPISNLPVVSIGISPYILFDPAQGLFMQGSHADPSSTRKSGANFWSRQEVTANIELYESDGRQVYNSLSGLRLFGGMSRLFPQKSLALVARSNYGQKRIEHPVFGPDKEDAFKFLILRNSGSDFGRSHLRDALITTIVEDWELDIQAYRPSHVYINGDYWGIYNIREKINRYFLASHHDVDKDSLDLLEHYMTLKRGSRRPYQRLLSYMHEHDLSDPVHYAYVRRQIDVDNFMDYHIAQIFFDNRDAGGNIRFWRPQTEHGQWRWILYDTDWGMGLHHSDAATFNSLAFHTEADGPSWPNPPWSTFLLRSMLESDAFRTGFINRFADRLNTDLQPPDMESDLEQMYQLIRPEMPRHLDRWRLSEHRWNADIERIRTFLRDRPAYMWEHLAEAFNTGPRRPVELEATVGGRIELNKNIEVRQHTFRGSYFANIPITLQAVPNYGYRFSHWEGLDYKGESHELYLRLDKEGGIRLKAIFEPYDHPLAGSLIINEIAPNNKKSDDWIELYNATDQRLPLRGFILRDAKGHEFAFPNQAYIGPKDYLVICEDRKAFKAEFPRTYNVIGDFEWGVNKHRETLELFTADGAMIDSVAYELPPTDSLFSYDLLLPRLNNADPENWRVLSGLGSPNAPNPYYVESSIRQRQNLWMQIGFGAAVLLVGAMLLIWRPYTPQQTFRYPDRH